MTRSHAKCDVLLAVIGRNWLMRRMLKENVAWIARTILCESKSRLRFDAKSA